MDLTLFHLFLISGLLLLIWLTVFLNVFSLGNWLFVLIDLEEKLQNKTIENKRVQVRFIALILFLFSCIPWSHQRFVSSYTTSSWSCALAPYSSTLTSSSHWEARNFPKFCFVCLSAFARLSWRCSHSFRRVGSQARISPGTYQQHQVYYEKPFYPWCYKHKSDRSWPSPIPDTSRPCPSCSHNYLYRVSWS